MEKEGYLKALQEAGEGSRGIADLDRSEFFRHRKDFEVFALEVKSAREGGKRLKFLEIGVGNMQEPISFLAAAHSELGDAKLEDVIDMELVEIRSRGNVNVKYRMGKQAFFEDQPVKPKAYKDSFSLVDGEYEPNVEIKKYFSRMARDETKAHFGTPVENFTKNSEKRTFDIIACNNVIQHMGGYGDYTSPYKNSILGERAHAKYFEELGKILDLVKEGGVIFIHAPFPGDRHDTKGKGSGAILKNLPNFEKEFEEISPGIYRRKQTDKQKNNLIFRNT